MGSLTNAIVKQSSPKTKNRTITTGLLKPAMIRQWFADELSDNDFSFISVLKNESKARTFLILARTSTKKRCELWLIKEASRLVNLFACYAELVSIHQSFSLHLISRYPFAIYLLLSISRSFFFMILLGIDSSKQMKTTKTNNVKPCEGVLRYNLYWSPSPHTLMSMTWGRASRRASGSAKMGAAGNRVCVICGRRVARRAAYGDLFEGGVAGALGDVVNTVHCHSAALICHDRSDVQLGGCAVCFTQLAVHGGMGRMGQTGGTGGTGGLVETEDKHESCVTETDNDARIPWGTSQGIEPGACDQLAGWVGSGRQNINLDTQNNSIDSNEEKIKIQIYKFLIHKQVHVSPRQQRKIQSQPLSKSDSKMPLTTVSPHGGQFAVNQKATLEMTDQFEDFLGEWEGPLESCKFAITLVENFRISVGELVSERGAGGTGFLGLMKETAQTQ
ncbi:hypothetical protein VP01_2327g1 [Puccinia sorghi]|uniref:Uncharacterized protein n=1 Tax=Puccinia sorghi TaxID=27349 RepID=A0A0L6V7P8_9BASI|nr:hypothetical protein VP01_2327g1 [Puccinia sorghi]